MIPLLASIAAAAVPLPRDVQLPVQVASAVSVAEVTHVDEAAGTFDGTVDVLLRWRDPSAAFDPRQAGTDQQVFIRDAADARRAELWDPHIEVANLAGDPDARDTSLRIHADGRIEYTQRLRGTFDTPIDLARFPFDSQRLAVRLTSPDHDARQVVLVHGQADAERSAISPDVVLPEWTIAPRMRFAGDEVRGLDGMLHSELQGSVGISRLARAYVASLFAPLAVILMLPVLCIWVKTDIHERINWVITAVFSLIALNFSVSVSYPALGIDSLFMRLFWYGYVAQGVALALIMLLFNESRLAGWLGEDLLAEATSYLSWSLPLVIALAFGDVILALAT